MKIIFLMILFYSSAIFANENKGFILEKREHDAVYLAKEKLNNPTSVPKINALKQANNFISIQVNVNASGINTVGDAANEPSLAVNPLDPSKIAVGWRQFDTVSNSFRQAGRSHSTDGGLTWSFQTVLEPGVFRSAPVLMSNAEGHFYYQSLKVDFDSIGNANDFRVDQWKSYDGGATWVEKTFAYGGDKSWIAIDKTYGPGAWQYLCCVECCWEQFFSSHIQQFFK